MKLYIFACIFFIYNILNGQKKEYQSFRKGDFPEGIYMTLEDVLNKTPTSTTEVYYKSPAKSESDHLPQKVYFYEKQNNEKIRKPLAVSYQGELYFQTYKKYTNKDDRGFLPDQFSRFCKVTGYGRFLYFEENMSDGWAKALISTSITSRPKAVVLDAEKKEFNILPDCDDLNDFLFDHEIPSVPCDPDKFNIEEARNKIKKVNEPYQ